jgi:hypothetical protein
MTASGSSSEIEAIFDRLDTIGRIDRTAQVSMNLANNSMMTLRAGGPGVHSWPPTPPFEDYEVLVTNEPPRFWHKYSDDAISMYDKVPKLLVRHHIIRSGGMYGLDYEQVTRTRVGLMNLKIAVPEDIENTCAVLIMETLRSMTGVHMVSSTYSL